MKLLALIPARGGSKGIPHKNIRSFGGKPLLQWSIEAALAVSSIDQVVVSTDDPDIASIAASSGAEVPFLRPSELATDAASGIAPVLHALEELPDITDVLLLQPTSPLRTSADIERIIDVRKQHASESAVSLTPSGKHPAWMYTLDQDSLISSFVHLDEALPRQQLSTAYVLNGALYLASRAFLLKKKAFISTGTVGYVMPLERSVDIDTPLDWKWAEFLMEQQA